MSKAKVEYNVLDGKTLDDLYYFSRTPNKQPDRTNFFGWDPRVVGHSNAIFFFELPEGDLKDRVKTTFIEKGIFEKEPKKWTANVALYSRYSFIPWHNDAMYAFTATVYLNKHWDKDWGGYLLYEDDNEIKCHIPTYNSCVCYTPPKDHSVQLTSMAAPMRESLQVFVNEWA